VRTQIINFLLEHQNQDGSWGFFPGKAGVIEPTAYALMSLASERRTESAMERGVAFLKRTQTPQGAWAISTQDSEEAAWATALAGLALLRLEGAASMRTAAELVVSAFASHPRPWVLRLADWMRSFDASYVEENLRGWKWTPETANWVEPTSYALLFLKKYLQSASGRDGLQTGSSKALKPVIAEAESLLCQRMCKEGGWNYGNARVLGEELRPYPLTTAIALIALQDSSRPECQRSLSYLQRAVPDERSALALSMTVLCFTLYGVQAAPWLQAAEVLYEETQFFQNIKTSALALLAMQSLSGENTFRL
jgi:Prenyltransferase and squalene oxidase repeat